MYSGGVLLSGGVCCGVEIILVVGGGSCVDSLSVISTFVFDQPINQRKETANQSKQLSRKCSIRSCTAIDTSAIQLVAR